MQGTQLRHRWRYTEPAPAAGLGSQGPFCGASRDSIAVRFPVWPAEARATYNMIQEAPATLSS